MVLDFDVGLLDQGIHVGGVAVEPVAGKLDEEVAADEAVRPQIDVILGLVVVILAPVPKGGIDLFGLVQMEGKARGDGSQRTKWGR